MRRKRRVELNTIRTDKKIGFRQIKISGTKSRKMPKIS